MLFFNYKLALFILAYRIIIENIIFNSSRSRFGITKEIMKFYPVWLIIQSFSGVYNDTGSVQYFCVARQKTQQ